MRIILVILLFYVSLFTFSSSVFAQSTLSTITPTLKANACDPDPAKSMPCLDKKTYCALRTDNVSFYYECAPIPSAPKDTDVPVVCSKGLSAEDDKNGTRTVTEDPKKIKRCLEIDTAIGPISTEPQGFVRSIFTLVLGLSGGIALVLIILAGYKTMTSGGNPEATKAANEQLTSAIIGLLFIIFAFVILQIVGVDILKIPGFSN